jgi:predicted acyl esterase
MAALATLLLTLAIQGGDPPTPPGGFAIQEQLDVSVAFSDGNTTACDVRYPTAPPGPNGWPVVVFVHGLFGSKAAVASVAHDFAEWGYFTVAYDVRGHASSTGVHTFFGLRERIDLAEVIYWSLTQYAHDTDDTRLGLAGGSQGGIFSWDGAGWSGAPYETNPWTTGVYPTIGAIVADNLTADFGDTFAPQALGVHCSGAASLLSNIGVAFDTHLQADAEAAFVAEDYAAWRSIVTDPQRDPSAHPGLFTVPTMVMTAWDDYWFPASSIIDTWKQIPTATPHKLYLGTGGHSSPSNIAEGAFRNGWRRAWFDRFFKQIANGIDSGPAITYAVTPNTNGAYLGLNSQWAHETARTWPPEMSRQYRIYLHDNTRLSPFAPRGNEAQEQLVQTVAVGYGPQDIVDSDFRLAQIEPFIDHTPLDYDTAPLASAIPYAGDVRVHLAVSCATTRYQVTASLWDVDPTGTARYVASGSHFVFDDIQPGPNQFDLTITSNAYVFEIGHRIRLELDSMAIHQPPIGASLRYAPYACDFQVDVQHDKLVPSYFELPVDEALPIVYGFQLENSAGCKPSIGIEGTASATFGAPCTLSALDVMPDKPGILLYGFDLTRKINAGGWLYIKQPLRRSPLLHSTPTGANPACNGVLAIDFNLVIQSGNDPALVPGTRIYAQFWSRDPAGAPTTSLSNAIEFLIAD